MPIQLIFNLVQPVHIDPQVNHFFISDWTDTLVDFLSNQFDPI